MAARQAGGSSFEPASFSRKADESKHDTAKNSGQELAGPGEILPTSDLGPVVPTGDGTFIVVPDGGNGGNAGSSDDGYDVMRELAEAVFPPPAPSHLNKPDAEKKEGSEQGGSGEPKRKGARSPMEALRSCSPCCGRSSSHDDDVADESKTVRSINLLFSVLHSSVSLLF